MTAKEINWEAAASYWTSREVDEKRMPQAELLAKIEEFIGSHKTCAVACAGNGIVRNTPVEYLYAEGAFWIFSEGGLKFKALQASSDVCLAIYNDDPSFGGLAGLQVTAKAEVLAPFGDEYVHACELRGLPIERLEGLPFTMNIIKVSPTRYDYLDSALKRDDYSSRQHLELE